MSTRITDEDRVRWDELRQHGRRVQEAIHALAAEVGVGDDPLDFLAFITGTIREPVPATREVPGFSYRFHLAKAKALEVQGITFPMLAEAMGEVPEGAGDQVARRAEQRVRARYHDNQKRLDEHLAAHGLGPS